MLSAHLLDGLNLSYLMFTGSWQPTVPSWEKAFCKVVGSLDWEIILDMKRFVHLYDNVVKWNDSAGEEAFHDAKKRFLAKIRGLPCDISLPNPDLYIDEVDWDSEVDPELLLDLEREYSIPDASENHETVVIFGDSLYSNEAFSAAGWGENEDNFMKATNLSSNNPENPREKVIYINRQTANENGWGEAVQNTHPLDEGGGTVGRETSWYSNQYGYHVIEPKEKKVADNDVVQGTWDVNNGKKEDGGGFSPRNNTSRFHGNEQKGSSKWRNGKGQKRESFLYENSTTVNKKLPSKCWKPSSSCGPLNYHGSGEAGQTWNLEKPIL